LGTDAAGDLFIGDFGLKTVAEVPAGCTSSSCWKTIGTGWQEPDSVSVDAAGDVFVGRPRTERSSGGSSRVHVERLPDRDGEWNPDGRGYSRYVGRCFHFQRGHNQIVEISQALPPSLSFALTNVGSTSADSPQLATIQNIATQPLAGSLALTFGTNFTQNSISTCGSGFSLNPGASCAESFSFTPQSTGYQTGTAAFSDNTFHLSPLVVLQTSTSAATAALNGQPVGVAVPNVVGLTQAAATTGSHHRRFHRGDREHRIQQRRTAGSVSDENPAAGTQATPGSAVRLLVSTGQASPAGANPLSLLNNYFVTGDYAAAGVTLRGTGQGGMATGTINIPDSTTNPGVSQGVPTEPTLWMASRYWETLGEYVVVGNTGTFLGYPISDNRSKRPAFTDAR